MFIQLTRADGLPIWINASFVVTVEPARTGGSIVVPIGDGLDYDVKEAPETVLALLKEAPPAKVVPVPPPKALTKTPDDVSPDTGYRRGDPESVEDVDQPAAETPKAGKKKPSRRKAAAKKTEAAPPPSPPKAAPVEEPEDFEKIIADLKARKCRTAKRARNAIKSFFRKTDDSEIDRIIEAMINRGYMLIGSDGHITWTAE